MIIKTMNPQSLNKDKKSTKHPNPDLLWSIHPAQPATLFLHYVT